MHGELLLEVSDLVKEFPHRRGLARAAAPSRAVDRVSFRVAEGETFGLVGESGCGKSTTARLIMGLLKPTSGRIRYRGIDVAAPRRGELALLRREVGMIFQDPYSSLNPRMTVGAIIGEPLAVHGLAPGRDERRRAVGELMDQVGLEPEHYNRLPHEFSGGQRQRIGIARALALKPRLIVADEPVSALDVSIQAQILNLVRRLQRELGLTIVFIAHDLSVVRHMCERIAVMYHGRIVELAGADALYAHPRHPYSGALLAAIPEPDPHAAGSWDDEPLGPDTVGQEVPQHGCAFRPRCVRAVPDPCAGREPALERVDDASAAACHFPVRG